MSEEKIGVGIVTYNSEGYFKSLYDSLYKDSAVFDELVVVNGGNAYDGVYKGSWVQHSVNKYPAVCRNEAVESLINKGCEHIFIIEDDMIIKDSTIFEKYIKASKKTGLKYFSYVSTSWESGEPGKRSPRLIVEYSEDVSVSFYKNMCNEFTYHHNSCFKKVGLYDTQFRDPFDIDMAFRESKQDYAAPFWWFADITDSDNLIQNNPVAVSRLQGERVDGSREQRIQEQWRLFTEKHKCFVAQIPDTGKEQLLSKLKTMRSTNKK